MNERQKALEEAALACEAEAQQWGGSAWHALHEMACRLRKLAEAPPPCVHEWSEWSEQTVAGGYERRECRLCNHFEER